VGINGSVFALLWVVEIYYWKVKFKSMKKLMFILIAAVLSVGAMAQSAVEKNQKDIKKDAREVRAERRQRNRLIMHGKFRKASREQKEVNIDRKGMNADKKELKIQGVKDPVKDAKKP